MTDSALHPHEIGGICMSRDNDVPAFEGHKPQARRLAEKALDASRAGDDTTADALFAEADRLDPEAV
ncbi:MAG: hypothetical protein J0H99_01765, partial [Rhodospirillales bacterium]|nr:hypothetical protein [Rhodospirillales bacterium]